MIPGERRAQVRQGRPQAVHFTLDGASTVLGSDMPGEPASLRRWLWPLKGWRAAGASEGREAAAAARRPTPGGWGSRWAWG